jgi:hypothetical protein
MPIVRRSLCLAALLGAAIATPALATEGGSGAYLLGSRDTMAGIVPPEGTYLTVDAFNLSGTAPFISLGGAVVSNADINVWITKINLTRSFGAKVLGGRFAITFTQPVVTGSMTFEGTAANGLAGQFTDNDTGLGDTVITSSMGYDHGLSHWNLQLSLYLPLGYFEPATVTLHPLNYQVLSFGKNRIAVDPTVAYTHFNPKTGFEVSGAFGVTFSALNTATDYQTAPELHGEMVVMQHLKNGLAFGATGYGYGQIANDSGSGAEALQAAYGAKSLQARVFGAGPMATWSTKVGGHPLSFKLKYVWEFEAKRRFESDVFQVSASFGF